MSASFPSVCIIEPEALAPAPDYWPSSARDGRESARREAEVGRGRALLLCQRMRQGGAETPLVARP